MKKTILVLAGLLVAQALAAMGLNETGPDLSARTSTTPLLAVDRSKIDHITIEGPDQGKVEIAKVDGSWKLPQENDFPADGQRVTQMLDRMEKLKLGLPVATSSDAEDRFKVSDKTFERRIAFAGDNKNLATIYLGSSPSMREVNARRAGTKGIYAVNLATYDVPVKAESWEDTSLLEFPEKDIQSIAVDNLTLTREASPAPAAKGAGTGAAPAAAGAGAGAGAATGGTAKSQPAWQASALGAGESLDSDAADRLATQVANLHFGSVLGKQDEPDYGLAQPALQLTVTRKDGKTVDYTLGKMADGKAYALKVSTQDEYFRVPTYSAQNLLNAAKRDALVKSGSTASASASGTKPVAQGKIGKHGAKKK
jgi:hypothetical protein